MTSYHEVELQIALNAEDPRNALPVIPAEARTILDIGCGSGQTLIAANRNGASAFGLDLDMDALREGNRRQTEICFAAASGEAIPFRDGSFDMVICRVTLPYMHIPTALAEVHRVLAPGGGLWLLLHGRRMYQRRFWASLRRGDWKDLIFLAYITVNSLLLHAGVQFRFPIKRRCESFQTKASISRALKKAGFAAIKVQQTRFFVVTAQKATDKP